nr:EOG090X057R [Triops cancriformis]
MQSCCRVSCAKPLLSFSILPRFLSITTSKSATAPVEPPKPHKTCLYDLHLKHGGKMVNFGGYLMPVQYGSEGIAFSHKLTRSSCSIFDVSHMLQSHLHGADRIAVLESIMVGDVAALKDNQGTLSVLTNQKGGIIDDFIVSKTKDFLYIVSNAGCRDKDLALFNQTVQNAKSQGKDVELEVLDNRGLLAVQGPSMVSVVQPHIDIDLSQLYFMNTVVATVCGVPKCRITRCGYTGEDGVEISVPAEAAADITEKLLKNPEAKLAGLGARDSLRLEAGLCLYGNDMNEDTTPVEASLLWLIAKSRRAQANFPGAAIILDQIQNQSYTRKRVGFLSQGPPARAHTLIYDKESNKAIGEITSGCPSPSLGNWNVSMGYIDKASSKIGTEVVLEIRKKPVSAKVAKMPFVPSKYYTKK